MIWRRASALAVAVAVSASVLSSVAPAQPMARDAFVAPATPAFGAFVPMRPGLTAVQSLAATEAELGTPLPMVTMYRAWNDTFPNAYANHLRATGHRLLLVVKLKRNDGTRPRWADLAAAAPGSALANDLERWADSLAAYGAPVWFAFHKEPEEPANVANGTAADFRAAFRRLVSEVRAAGATNVRFVWTLTQWTFDPRSGRNPETWFPGDDVVDVAAASGGNWFGCRAGMTNAWRSVDQIFAGLRSFRARHPSLGMGLVEFESVEDAALPRRKAGWLTAARSAFKQARWDALEFASYFDSVSDEPGADCDWRLRTSSYSLSAASAFASDPYFRP